MKRRITCLLLALLMLSASAGMYSCGDGGKNDEETKGQNETAPEASGGESESDEATAETDAPLTDKEKRQLISDDLPDTTFNGNEIRFCTYSDTDYTQEISVEDLNGEACNDSIYNRNLNVEKRFDVKITGIADSAPWSKAGDVAKAGTDDYHVIGFFDYLAYIPINAQALVNWCDVPHVNLEKPWHNQLSNNDSTINGKLFGITSDLAITSLTYTIAIFMNIPLAENYGFTTESVYDTVKEGKWTIDYFTNAISTMYEDKDGNGKRDVTDTYGFGYVTMNPADVWLTAFDQKICTPNDQGGLDILFMSDKTVSILDKLLEMHINNPGFIEYDSGVTGIYYEEKAFKGRSLVFAPLRFNAAFAQLRDMEDPYTILPYPKWDENQERYLTKADDKYTLFGIPTSVYNDLDFVGTIYEALSAESYKTVFPEYYDTALKGKYSTDETTAEMVDIIFSGRLFDFSYQFGDSVFARVPYMIRDMLVSQKNTLASTYKAKEKALTKSLNKMLEVRYGD